MNSRSHQSSSTSLHPLPRARIHIGLAGMGTVGSGVVKILEKNAALIAERSHADIRIHSVLVRDPLKAHAGQISPTQFVKTPQELVDNQEINLIIEAMGGHGDPAYSLVKDSLKAGKAVITANKALLAHHGLELAQIAEANNVPLYYEASVAGGIPIIKLVREGLGGNRISKILGIMNGTSNYILSTMEQSGAGFAEVLQQAQDLGYAESDPTLDIGGGDAAHKLALLTALCFGCAPDCAQITCGGIEHVTPEDIAIAAEFKCRIKLVAQAERLHDGRILQMVVPTLVPYDLPLAHVGGVLNGIYLRGDFVGTSFIEGRGAGAGPTASAILSDILDYAMLRGGAQQVDVQQNNSSIHAAAPAFAPIRPVFGVSASQLKIGQTTGGLEWYGRYYIRLRVMDRPGVIADIAPILRDHLVSIESLIQRGQSEDDPVSIIILTHAVKGKNIADAAHKLTKLPAILQRPMVMPILDADDEV